MARAHAADPAVTFLDDELRSTTYTFEELHARSREVGERLARSGVPPQYPIGILLRSQHDQVLHYLGALAAGLVPAILTPPNRKLNRRYYVETMDAVLQKSRFAALVTDVPELRSGGWRFAPFSIDRLDEAPAAFQPEDAVHDASFLQFSSGTTGIKRGVVVSDSAVLGQLEAYSHAIGVGQHDVILSWLPLYHDMGFIACLNLPLAVGVHSVMMDPIDWVTRPSLFLRAATIHRATLAWQPNFAYAFMAQRVRDDEIAGVDLSSLRGLANCSEPVTHESQEQFRRRFEPFGLRRNAFWGCYAMAETTFALTHGTSADADYRSSMESLDGSPRGNVDDISVGRPLAGVDLRVFDDDGRELGDRRIGEFWVRSPFNFDRYHNDDDATQAAFVDGWYKTGDLGYRIGDAYFVSGRKKDVMIVGGVNVFPQDIEDVVVRLDGVRAGRVSAFSAFDERVQTERIVVLFEANDHEDINDIVVAIRQHLLAAFQIANFEVHFVPSGWLVKSSSGKMARRANREKWTAESTGQRVS